MCLCVSEFYNLICLHAPYLDSTCMLHTYIPLFDSLAGSMLKAASWRQVSRLLSRFAFQLAFMAAMEALLLFSQLFPPSGYPNQSDMRVGPSSPDENLSIIVHTDSFHLDSSLMATFMMTRAFGMSLLEVNSDVTCSLVCLSLARNHRTFQTVMMSHSSSARATEAHLIALISSQRVVSWIFHILQDCKFVRGATPG